MKYNAYDVNKIHGKVWYNFEYMKSSITQSQAWKNLQDELGEESVFATEEKYQYLAITKSTPAGKYLYCPYGPVASTPEGFQQAIKSLIETAKTNNAIFIRVEPYEESQASILPPLTRKSIDLNPKETWLLDLKGTDEELRAKLPSRLLRYYKSASKKGITITTSHDPNDIHYLLNLQKALASEKGISTFSEDYLKTELKQPFATLYLVKHQDETKEEIIAAGLVFDDETTRYNLQGAQSDEGRKLHATGILTIQLILDAKAKNLETFDFWGIAPEGAPADHPWAGFTNFKKTFAGYQYNHAGTYDIILKPAKYKLYQTLRKINRKRKK
ncbi:MAG: peptidoglycan bridge formation glycyltransferase FemA/FemB family protein [Candidatus Saccharibacteria bacterium]|nr:peptidoglycan bridge formation glycyltransferase FemA/FemB family protein [Candidatus Saccharibacteria bacterium]